MFACLNWLKKIKQINYPGFFFPLTRVLARILNGKVGIRMVKDGKANGWLKDGLRMAKKVRNALPGC